MGLLVESFFTTQEGFTMKNLYLSIDCIRMLKTQGGENYGVVFIVTAYKSRDDKKVGRNPIVLPVHLSHTETFLTATELFQQTILGIAYGRVKRQWENNGYTVTNVFEDNQPKASDFCYDASGFTIQGFNVEGYDREGYDQEGYNKEGWNRIDYGRDGYNKQGYDSQGYGRDGYNEKGFDKHGFDRDGWDSEGYGVDGFNSHGYNRNLLNRDGYDMWGYNPEGFDQNGFDKEGYNRNGFDRNGLDRYGNSEANI